MSLLPLGRQTWSMKTIYRVNKVITLLRSVPAYFPEALLMRLTGFIADPSDYAGMVILQTGLRASSATVSGLFPLLLINISLTEQNLQRQDLPVPVNTLKINVITTRMMKIYS